MPTVLASAIAAKAATVLQDAANVRWTTPEMLGWINSGQKEIVLLKPDASVVTKAVLLAAGTRQTLGVAPTADAVLLLRVHRNMGTTGTAAGPVVTVISGEVLDAQLPGWHYATESSEVEHYVYDPLAPLQYYVTPPNDGTGYVEMSYSAVPVAISAIGNAITISDIFENALVDYVLYRAFGKDAEEANNMARSEAHYRSFTQALGINTQNMLGTNPNVGTLPLNPSVPAGAK